MLMQGTGLHGILFIKKPGNASFSGLEFSIASKPFIKEYKEPLILSCDMFASCRFEMYVKTAKSHWNKTAFENICGINIALCAW